MQVINPATEEIIEQVTEDSEATVKEKYALLREGQPHWAAVPLEDRMGCIERFYELLDSGKEELAATLTSETGKPLRQSYNELSGARSRIKWFIDHATR